MEIKISAQMDMKLNYCLFIQKTVVLVELVVTNVLIKLNMKKEYTIAICVGKIITKNAKRIINKKEIMHNNL